MENSLDIPLRLHYVTILKIAWIERSIANFAYHANHGLNGLLIPIEMAMVPNGTKTALSKWPIDVWEVVKFFIPALGNNMSTVKNAESTDLSFFYILKWMKDVAFGGDRRADVDLVENSGQNLEKPTEPTDLDTFLEIAGIHAPLRLKKVKS